MNVFIHMFTVRWRNGCVPSGELLDDCCDSWEESLHLGFFLLGRLRGGGQGLAEGETALPSPGEVPATRASVADTQVRSYKQKVTEFKFRQTLQVCEICCLPGHGQPDTH